MIFSGFLKLLSDCRDNVNFNVLQKLRNW